MNLAREFKRRVNPWGAAWLCCFFIATVWDHALGGHFSWWPVTPFFAWSAAFGVYVVVVWRRAPGPGETP